MLCSCAKHSVNRHFLFGGFFVVVAGPVFCIFCEFVIGDDLVKNNIHFVKNSQGMKLNQSFSGDIVLIDIVLKSSQDVKVFVCCKYIPGLFALNFLLLLCRSLSISSVDLCFLCFLNLEIRKSIWSLNQSAVYLIFLI